MARVKDELKQEILSTVLINRQRVITNLDLNSILAGFAGGIQYPGDAISGHGIRNASNLSYVPFEFKMTFDATEAQVIDVMKKITTHKHILSKFCKASMPCYTTDPSCHGKTPWLKLAWLKILSHGLAVANSISHGEKLSW
ncbi:hypothetical protein KSP40_PGU011707 [Platanthera guangdongensis]|uniref:Uncharacterized protein n=1 Tax=Platanthera guangdongensis TaxID=2320717 RepID=A0ABR2LCJ3_9ASPA